jgi:hypothetical protein
MHMARLDIARPVELRRPAAWRLAATRSLIGREHLLDASDLSLQDRDLGVARVRLRVTSSSRTTR